MDVRQTTGEGGLPKLVLSHPEGGRAEVYLHGAHVTSWMPAGGGEALFLSREAVFDGAAALRGGIPVIFPQFAGLGPLPKHGFARTAAWDRVSAPGAGAVVLRLRDDARTRAVWPHAFEADLSVGLGDRTLEVELAVRNTGGDPFSFTAALHTYLRVAEVREAALEGVRGVRYRSQQEGVADGVDDRDALRFGGEVDRVYLGVPGDLRLVDAAAGREVRIAQRGFEDVVVWNPGAEKAAALPDMDGAEHREMACVEAAQVGTPVRLGPGGEWRGAQRLRV